MYPISSKYLAALLLILVLTACGSGGESPAPTPVDDTPPVAVCEHAPEPVVITGWRFSTDPQHAGEDEGWAAPDFDDSAWRTDVQPGMAWENAGIESLAGYDGAAWYRATITLPEWEAVYLLASGIDDEATVWANGSLLGVWKSQDTRATYTDLRAVAAPGDPVTLAIRVLDRGVYGGLVDPVRLAPQPQEGMTPAQVVAWNADAHPDWPMPGWTRDEPLAWTLTGGIDRPDEALVSMDGSVAPWAGAPVVDVWLFDPRSGALLSGNGITTFSLVDGDLPLPRWTWTARDVTVTGVLFFDEDAGATRWRVTFEPAEAARDFKALIAVRPFAVNRSAHAVYSASLLNPSRLWLDGAPYLITGTPPDAAGVGRLADVMAAALRGKAPQDAALDCAPEGDGAALLVYDRAPAVLDMAFPASPGAEFPAASGDSAQQLDAAVTFWHAQTQRVRFNLPDGRMTESLPASVGYLLLANDPDGPHPGSLAHDAVWVRDAAYTGLALLQAGHADTVKAYIPAIFDDQEPSGRVPPIQGEAIPWDDDEWDSQGQAIFLTVSYYRYTRDLDTLRTYYPNLRSAANFIVTLRQQTADAPESVRGLLPPSLSAEDIGTADQHHYWDDFWAVAGLEEAAYAAQVLGEPDDAAWMQAEADDLRAAILASITAVMGDDPAYIPGSVEDLEDSGMARGTVPALWPFRVFSPDLPLLARAFDTYHQRWIAPFDGAYQHRQGQFWPYGGIELAHAYLRLGRGDVLHQILSWTLGHQTLPGTYAWAEQVNPANGGFSGGDMPHAWAAASWFTLIREMVIAENGDALDLFTLAPEWWFEADRVVTVEHAPTLFGSLTLHTTSTITVTDGVWQGTLTLTVSGAEPPEGFRWVLPRMPTQIDGPDGTHLDGATLIVPSTGGSVTLTF